MTWPEKKCLWYACLLALGLFIFYVLSIPAWYLRDQDFTSLLRVACIDMSSWQDVINSFVYGKTLLAHCPFHHTALVVEGYGAPTSFFAPYYRPLLLLVHWIEYAMWGLNAYAYFIVAVALHTVTAGVFFYLLSRWVSWWAAWCGALWFAGHPSLQGWIFGFDCQQNSLALLFALLAIGSGYQGVIRSSRLWHILACCLLLCSWLTRETFLVVPPLLLFLNYVFSPRGLPLRQMSVGFNVTFAMYFLWRALVSSWVLPIAAHQSLIWCSYERLLTFGSFLYHLFVHQWFAWNIFFDAQAYHLLWLYRLLKCLLVLLTAYLFCQSSRKLFVLALWFVGLCLCWPMLMTGFQTRYYYEALPCFIAGFMLLVDDCKSFLRYGLMAFIGIVIVIHGIRIVQSCRHGERYARAMYQSALQYNFSPTNSVLIMSTLDTYLAEAFVLNQKRNLDQIYFFPYLTLHSVAGGDECGLIGRWDGNQLHITSSSDQIWMVLTPQVFGSAPYLENIIINRAEDERIYELTLVFNQMIPLLNNMQVYFFVHRKGIMHQLTPQEK